MPVDDATCVLGGGGDIASVENHCCGFTPFGTSGLCEGTGACLLGVTGKVQGPEGEER